MTWLECLSAPDKIDRQDVEHVLTAAVDACLPSVKEKPLMEIMHRDVQALFASVLEERYGAWSRGWCSTSVDGGLVSSWQSWGKPLRLADASVPQAIQQAIDALEEWRQCLRDIEALFHSLDRAYASDSMDTRIECGLVAITRHVVVLTDAQDAWYRTFETLAEWYLEHLGLDPSLITAEIERIIFGRFSSWVAPEEQSTFEVARDLAKLVDRVFEVESLNTTAQWLVHRGYAGPADSFRPVRHVHKDAHAEFITRFDCRRSPERGERMLQALDRCREDAKARRLLDWNRLSEWQALVLGLDEPPGFRVNDAYAKGGRERYPFESNSLEQFSGHLSDVNDCTRCPILSASVVYFDICFYHPFDDGNARSARLALEYVLRRHDLALLLPDVVFRLALAPGDHFNFDATLRMVTGSRHRFI